MTETEIQELVNRHKLVARNSATGCTFSFRGTYCVLSARIIHRENPLVANRDAVLARSAIVLVLRTQPGTRTRARTGL